MNTKLYWIIRDWWSKVAFFVKKSRFSASSKLYSAKKTTGFSGLILKTIFWQTIKAGVVCFFALCLDKIIMCITKQSTLNHQMFLDITIGGIGVAGVILGLYCSNMASIFSSKYTNAPESIKKLYQRDIVTNKCVRQITGYITLCVCFLAVCILKVDFSFVSIVLLLILTIRTIITFSISGNRAYDLSNTYRIADVVYPDIFYVLKKLTKRKGIDSDKSFQKHYRNLCANYIEVLKDIAVYNKSNFDHQTAPVITFLKRNLTVLFEYVKLKPSIPYNSLWFADKAQYQQWHTAHDEEISLKIKFGLMLETKEVRDYLWFESEMEEVNKIGLDMLIKAEDYSSIYYFLAILSSFSEGILETNSVQYWNRYIQSLKDKLVPIISKKLESNQSDDKRVGITDAYATTCFNYVMSIGTYFENLNIESVLNYAVSLDNYSTADFKKNYYLNNQTEEDFYQRIQTELKIEKKRITPPWYIEQNVAEQVFNHINLLTSQMAEMIELAFSIGDRLFNDKCYYQAAIWFCRLSEMDAKLSYKNVYERIKAMEKSLLAKKKDDKILWAESSISKSIERIKKVSQTIPKSLKRCSGVFALTHQECRTDFPDLFGYCYNRFCECLIDAIANNDYVAFKTFYEGFLSTALLYQEYIRTDVIKIKEEYRQKAVLHVFTAPIFEVAMISGLAILWGEFVETPEWRTIVEEEIKPYTDKSDTEKHSVLPKINQMISARKKSFFGIGNRDLIETRWEQTISAAIRNHPNYQIQYGKFGEQHIVSNSKLFNAFTRNSLVDLGVLHDVEDLFCILCINPYVQDDEKYHSQSKWEEDLDDEGKE